MSCKSLTQSHLLIPFSWVRIIRSLGSHILNYYLFSATTKFPQCYFSIAQLPSVNFQFSHFPSPLLWFSNASTLNFPFASRITDFTLLHIQRSFRAQLLPSCVDEKCHWRLTYSVNGDSCIPVILGLMVHIPWVLGTASLLPTVFMLTILLYTISLTVAITCLLTCG